MKRIFVLIIGAITMLPFCVYSQEQDIELSKPMIAFKSYCLEVRNAVQQRDLNALIECIRDWQPADTIDNKIIPETFYYNNVHIVYGLLGDFTCVDSLPEIPLGKHLKFLPFDVDNMITNDFVSVEINSASLLRDKKKKSNCKYAIRTLPPKEKRTYKTFGANDIEMFVVAENGGLINMYVHALERNFEMEIVNETFLSDTAPEGKPYAQLKWNMYYSGDIEVTVENMTDNEVSFILVRN